MLRPKLSVGIKTLISLTIVFWIPVIALTSALYFSFSDRLFEEGLDTVKTNLKGAQIIYDERAKNLQTVLKHITSEKDVKDAFTRKDSRKILGFLLDLGKNNPHAEILIAVNENQKVLSRRNGRVGDIVILGDALSRALTTGESVITTELVSKEFLSFEEESLASRSKETGIVQFVISPVQMGEEIKGAIISGILLSGESWLGNSIHNQFGSEMALFAGKTFESFYLHSTASLPRNSWIVGQSMPPLLKDEISLGKPFYGNLSIEGELYIIAFEPLRDSRNRIIGAMGVSRPAKNIMLIVLTSIGKILVIISLGALLVALGITALIYFDITNPLNTLLTGMQRFAKGGLDTTVKIKTGDEFEKLGDCFNEMAGSVKRREDRLKKHNQVAKLLMSTIDIKELNSKILSVVLDVTESQMGILYLCDEKGEILEPVELQGCRTDIPAMKATAGFPGRALAERKCFIVSPPHKEQDKMIDMGFIEFAPEDLAYIPLIYKESGLGVLVIGRLKGYSSDEEELFNYLGNQISIALDNSIVHRRIQELSISDHLTGLYNRRYLSIRLEEEWARCIRQKEPLSVILADMDDFKTINDTYGHDKGDEVLRMIGKILKSIARKEDVVARFGGEEFVVLFTNMASAEAVQKAEEIRSAVASANYPWADGEITVSIGVSTYPGVQIEYEKELIQTADKAMYEAKASGKNKVIVCT